MIHWWNTLKASWGRTATITSHQWSVLRRKKKIHLQASATFSARLAQRLSHISEYTCLFFFKSFSCHTVVVVSTWWWSTLWWRSHISGPCHDPNWPQPEGKKKKLLIGGGEYRVIPVWDLWAWSLSLKNNFKKPIIKIIQATAAPNTLTRRWSREAEPIPRVSFDNRPPEALL